MTSTIILSTPNSTMHSTFKGGGAGVIIGRRSASFRKVSHLPPQKTQHYYCSISSSSPKPSTSFSTLNDIITICTTRQKFSDKTCILSKIWRELQGANDWEYLVQPLHPLLRQEIIRYGEFVTACYKAFDLDPQSKRYLNCKYGKKTMFDKVGLHDSGYLITKYIYATPNINIPTQNGSSCGRWVGYVAVSSDPETKRVGRRDILVTFRGTVTNPEWIANLMSSLTRAGLDPHDPRPDVMVESGFLSLYTSNESDTSKFGLESCREQLLSELGRVISTYKNEEISITIAGHSMGSSLGLLLAYDISELGLNKDFLNRKIPVTVFSFAGPRVGNLGFKERVEKLGVKVLRIVNVNDPITKMPGFLFNENFRVFLGGKYYELPWKYYAHVGVELAIDFFKMQNPSCVHDLESYINLLRLHKRSPAVRVQCDEEEKCVRFLRRARELLSTSAQSFDISPWKDAACNMVNLVQSQRTT